MSTSKNKTVKQLNKAAHAAQRAVDAGWKALHKAQDEFVKAHCPYKVGDRLTAREWGRTRHFRVSRTSAVLVKGEGLVWHVHARVVTKAGEPRYGHLHISSRNHRDMVTLQALQRFA